MALLALSAVSVALAYLLYRLITNGHLRPSRSSSKQAIPRVDEPLPPSNDLDEPKTTSHRTNRASPPLSSTNRSSTPTITTTLPQQQRRPPPETQQHAAPPSSSVVPNLKAIPQMDRELMPPPPRPSSLTPANDRSPSLSAPRAASPQPQQQQAGLQVPRTGPVPNRVPSSNRPFSLQAPTSSLSPRTPITSLSASSTSPSSLSAQGQTQGKPQISSTASHTRSRKVVLKPGHSPLDWAVLSQNPKSNLNGLPLTLGGPTFLRVTPSLLLQMNGRKARPMWTSFKGRVYNIGPYLPFHPGGAGELKRCAGRAAEKLFDEVHPWVNFEGLLAACVVGVMVGEGDETATDDLEDLD